jgi:hypothetical protein
MVATTEFVINNSGFFPYKIYSGSSHMWVGSTSANIVVNGTSVLTAASSGVTLANGAVATTQSQAYNTTGDGKIATTEFAKTATTWWGGSAKFVSNAAPTSGQGNPGDFWFQFSNS